MILNTLKYLLLLIIRNIFRFFKNCENFN